MTHKAEVISVEHVADGILAVKARCCDDETTDSVLTVLELHRADEEIDADVANHLARVEKLHHARDRAKAHIERLIKK
jgi:hypothetical protein